MSLDERMRSLLESAGADVEPTTGDPARRVLFRVAKYRRRAALLGILTALLMAAGAATALASLRVGGTATRPQFASLLARPLHFPSVVAGQTCPATPGRPVETSFFSGVALGGGPVRVLLADAGNLPRGQVLLPPARHAGWFGLQTLWFSLPSYRGPFVVRGQRLTGHGRIEVQPDVTGLAHGAGPLMVPGGPTANAKDGYRTVPGSTWVTSPGCYAWQVDGRNFSEVIVVEVGPSRTGNRPTQAPGLTAATPAQVQAFLAIAQRGTAGTFATVYRATVGIGHGRTRSVIVTGAQRPGVTVYRETPAITPSAPGGAPLSRSFEVFSSYRPGTVTLTGPGHASHSSGLFSCTQAADGRWTCVGPYRGIGMGTTWDLRAPYPPQELFSGLDNVFGSYAGGPRIVAHLETRKLHAGGTLLCLLLGSVARPAGSVCLNRNGIIQSYALPLAKSYGIYRTATLLRYTPKVAPGTFTLPARSTPYNGL